MPNLSTLAAKFSDYHNAALTKAQALMIKDGLPPSFIANKADHSASWAGRTLTSAIETAPRLANQETEAMKKITAAAEKAKKMASKQAIHVPKKAKKPTKTARHQPTNNTAPRKQIGEWVRATLMTDGKKVGRKAQVISMMKATAGTTVDAICKETGMLPHSARALISGIAKIEKVATSKEAGEKTVYSIK